MRTCATGSKSLNLNLLMPDSAPPASLFRMSGGPTQKVVPFFFFLLPHAARVSLFKKIFLLYVCMYVCM